MDVFVDSLRILRSALCGTKQRVAVYGDLCFPFVDSRHLQFLYAAPLASYPDFARLRIGLGRRSTCDLRRDVVQTLGDDVMDLIFLLLVAGLGLMTAGLVAACRLLRGER